MAFTTINNSEFSRKLYTGIAAAKVIAVNPTKEESEKYFGQQQNEPNYISMGNVDGKDVQQVRIEFILEIPKPGDDGVFYQRVSFFLNKAYAANKDQTKLHVIDKYGRTAWALKQEVKENKIPVFANGQQARIDKDYKPLIIGEDRVNILIRALFCLNDPERFDPDVNGYVMRTGKDLENCAGILDHTKDFFSGDYSELRDAIELAKNNTVYCLLGIRTNDEGRQYQTVYNNLFVRKTRSWNYLERDFNKALVEFCPANSEFEVCPLKEFTVTPTDFGKLGTNNTPPASEPEVAEAPAIQQDDDLPFGDAYDWNV